MPILRDQNNIFCKSKPIVDRPTRVAAVQGARGATGALVQGAKGATGAPLGEGGPDSPPPSRRPCSMMTDRRIATVESLLL